MSDDLEPDVVEYTVGILSVAGALAFLWLTIKRIPHVPLESGRVIGYFLITSFVVFGGHEVVHWVVAGLFFDWERIEYELPISTLRTNMTWAGVFLAALLVETAFGVQFPLVVSLGLVAGLVTSAQDMTFLSPGGVYTPRGQQNEWIALAGPIYNVLLGVVLSSMQGLLGFLGSFSLLVGLVNSLPFIGLDGDHVVSSGNLLATLVLVFAFSIGVANLPF